MQLAIDLIPKTMLYSLMYADAPALNPLLPPPIAPPTQQTLYNHILTPIHHLTPLKSNPYAKTRGVGALAGPLTQSPPMYILGPTAGGVFQFFLGVGA
jgi:hypothetical protein